MPKTTTWELPAHSAAKHELLRRYLEGWYAKLAWAGARRPGSQLNFIDAFAGPGIFDGGEPGSPIIALQALLNHQSFTSWARVQFHFYFVEADVERFRSLTDRVALLWANREDGQPGNVTVQIVNKSFFETVTDLVNISTSKGGTGIPVPTFAFVDPFGFSDLPIADLCSLLRTGSCEVLFNFMYNDINRFFTYENPKHQAHLKLLFDFDEPPSVEGLTALEREEVLNDQIGRVFRQKGDFDYVRSFTMEGLTDRTLYSLFFATHRVEGLEVMKDVMWKIDPAEGRRFSDRLANQPSLFAGSPNFAELRKLVLKRLESSELAIQELMNFVTIDTDFKSSHLKVDVLKPLESEGQIVVRSTNPKRRIGTFAEGCTIALATQAN